jgi:hypothetical protein
MKWRYFETKAAPAPWQKNHMMDWIRYFCDIKMPKTIAQSRWGSLHFTLLDHPKSSKRNMSNTIISQHNN